MRSDVPIVDLRGPREVEGREFGHGAKPSAHRCSGDVHPAVRLHLDRPDALYRAVSDDTVVDLCDAFADSLCDFDAHADVEC